MSIPQAFLTFLLIAVSFLAPTRQGSGEEKTTLYDADPAHPWNRLSAALFLRRGMDNQIYGADSLDLLYWSGTKHLLEGDSSVQALRALDQFLAGHSETLITDPLKRALLQRDLWALFDWAVMRNRYLEEPFQPAAVRELASRLATAIRRLALSKEQIVSLPDNYDCAVRAKSYPSEFDAAQPGNSFLPADLLVPEGPWVCVECQSGLIPAPIHTREFGGRSVFVVFINLPGGRKATLDYLDRLNHFAEPWVFDRAKMEAKGSALVSKMMAHSFNAGTGPWVNPAMPQFPNGTKFALLRRAIFIDAAGELVPSPLTESLQMRVYSETDPARVSGTSQSVYEFNLSRADLLASRAGGLKPVAAGEKEFSTFLQMGIDPLEFKSQDNEPPADPRSTALSCIGCHTGPGIHSVLSHSQLFTAKTLLPPQYERSDPERLGSSTTGWKSDQFTWGLLMGLWQSER